MIDEKKLISDLKKIPLDTTSGNIDFVLGMEKMYQMIMKEIEKQPATNDKWIFCSEKMPEKNQQVIYCDECGLVGFALYIGNDTFWDNCAEFYDVIAWQPRPNPVDIEG